MKPDAKSYSHFSRSNRFFKPIGSLYLASMCLLHICIRYVIFCYNEICNFFCCCCIFCYEHILFISDFRFMLLGEICKSHIFKTKRLKISPIFYHIEMLKRWDDLARQIIFSFIVRYCFLYGECTVMRSFTYSYRLFLQSQIFSLESKLWPLHSVKEKLICYQKLTRSKIILTFMVISEIDKNHVFCYLVCL